MVAMYEQRPGVNSKNFKTSDIFCTKGPHPGPLPEGEGSFNTGIAGVFSGYQADNFFIMVYL